MSDTDSGINSDVRFSTFENETCIVEQSPLAYLVASSASYKQKRGAHPNLDANVVENPLEFKGGES